MAMVDKVVDSASIMATDLVKCIQTATTAIDPVVAISGIETITIGADTAIGQIKATTVIPTWIMVTGVIKAITEVIKVVAAEVTQMMTEVTRVATEVTQRMTEITRVTTEVTRRMTEVTRVTIEVTIQATEVIRVTAEAIGMATEVIRVRLGDTPIALKGVMPVYTMRRIITEIIQIIGEKLREKPNMITTLELSLIHI